jgi:hypothetical protein
MNQLNNKMTDQQMKDFVTISFLRTVSNKHPTPKDMARLANQVDSKLSAWLVEFAQHCEVPF